MDVFHSPSCHVLPSQMAKPGVVTLHDLSLVDHLATKRRSPVSRYERAAFLGAASRATHIITISDTVRRELTERLGVESHRITTIYPGVPRLEGLPAPGHVPPQAEGAFLLTVGTIEPRKNLNRLLDAHEMVWRELRLPLLLVGVYGWSQRALLRRVAASDGRVFWLGFVSDPVLAELYRRATAVMQYSSYEGFDLPVAEALACGAPLVASDIPVHREVARDCAVYAHACDPEALVRAVTEVVRWPEDRRRSHREAAAARLAELRRGDPIVSHIEVYRRVIEES